MRIEPGALVVDADFHSFRRALQNNVNGLALILTISMQYGVGHGLAHRHVNPKRGILANARTAYKRSDRSGRRCNRINAAG